MVDVTKQAGNHDDGDDYHYEDCGNDLLFLFPVLPPQFSGLLNFPYDTILSAGAFLVTDAFLHACSVISCFFAETTFLDFFQHPFLTHCWPSQRPHGSSITIAAKDFFSNFPFFGKRRKATSNLPLSEYVFYSFLKKDGHHYHLFVILGDIFQCPPKLVFKGPFPKFLIVPFFDYFIPSINKTALFKAYSFKSRPFPSFP